jgi:hypothetical protein
MRKPLNEATCFGRIAVGTTGRHTPTFDFSRSLPTFTVVS